MLLLLLLLLPSSNMVCFSPTRASRAFSASLITLILYIPGIVLASPTAPVSSPPLTTTTSPSSSSSSSNNIFESIHQLPRGWTRTADAQPNDPVKLRISLKQQNLDTFYESLLQVSSPDHPRYGQHYEAHELRSLLRPAPEAARTAMRWLQAHNVTTVRDDGEYLFVRTDVATASTLLDTTFAWYRQAGSGERLLRTTRYSVPGEVAAHINFVQPTTRFGGTRPLASHVDVLDQGQASEGVSKWVTDATAGAVTEDEFRVNAASAVNATCAQSITPQCLFQLYNINLKGSSAGNNSVGYASFVGQSARFTDMAEFSKVYAPFTAARNVS